MLGRISSLISLGSILIFTAAIAAGQGSQTSEEISRKPIYITARIFQLKTKRGSAGELTDQVFKMRTASLSEDEKWISALKKSYPNLEIALLRTESRRIFRTSKPGIISLVRQPDGRDIQVTLNGAQSPGDGVTPGTSLISEIGLHFGNDLAKPPVTFAIQPMEVENGMSYFFAAANLKMNAADYVKFIRPSVPVEVFDGQGFFLVFAFSVDLDQNPQSPRFLDERQSVQLQDSATKKAQPEIAAGVREAGLGGFIRVRLDISAGKVTNAGIHFSSFPEINNEALAAARQWEFPDNLFAEDKRPVTGFLTFSFPAKGSAPAPKSPTNPPQK